MLTNTEKGISAELPRDGVDTRLGNAMGNDDATGSQLSILIPTTRGPESTNLTLTPLVSSRRRLIVLRSLHPP